MSKLYIKLREVSGGRSGAKGENSIEERCRQEGIAQSLYYSFSKEFLEACKKRLAGGTARKASTSEVKDLHRETQELKGFIAEQILELCLLKKKMIGPLGQSWGDDESDIYHPSGDCAAICREGAFALRLDARAVYQKVYRPR